MTLQYLLYHYGYFAILLGTFLEGETILVLAGIAARIGFLKLHWVIVCAFIGTLLGDQLYYLIGRYHGKAFLARHPKWNRRMERAHRAMARYHELFILGFRFLYGIRSVTSFFLGTTEVPPLRFMLLNMAGALVWAMAVGWAGYGFGYVLETWLGDLKHFEYIVLGGFAMAGITFWLGYHFRNWRSEARGAGN